MNFSLLMFDTAIAPVFAAAAAAPDGAWISTAAISALCAGLGAVLGKLWPSKVRAEVKRPVDSDDTYVTTGQCRQHRCSLEKRIDTLVPLLTKISDQVASSSARAEERAVQLHRRLDPIVEKVAANAAELDIIKDLNFKGGKK